MVAKCTPVDTLVLANLVKWEHMEAVDNDKLSALTVMDKEVLNTTSLTPHKYDKTLKESHVIVVGPTKDHTENAAEMTTNECPVETT